MYKYMYHVSMESKYLHVKLFLVGGEGPNAINVF